MADEKTDYNDTSTTTSSLRENEDVGGQRFPAYHNRRVQNASVPSRGQTAASPPSSSQTVDFNKNVSQTRVPFESPVKTTGCVSLAHLAKETPSTSEAALTALSLGPIRPFSSPSLFPSNATVSQPLSSGSSGSGLVQSSNASACRPYQKRRATQPPPTGGRAVRGRIDSSAPASAQAALPLLAYPMQTASVPPQAQTTDFLPSPAETAHRSSRLATGTPLRISQDQPISVSRGGGLAKASNVPAGSYQKGHATQPTPNCGRAMWGMIDPPAPASAQAASPPLARPNQTASVSPQAQIADFVPIATAPPQAQISEFVPLVPAPPQAQIAGFVPILPRPPPAQIDLFMPTCFFCSLILEASAVTGYPCGHCYHTYCLQLFASTVRARNLPCILCGFLF